MRGFALDKEQSSLANTPPSASPPVPAEDNEFVSMGRNVEGISKLNEEQKPVHVSVVAAPSSGTTMDVSLPPDNSLPENRIVAVGRSDGSVFMVRLGSQYLTKFMAVPKLVVEENGNDETTVRVDREWMNSEEMKNNLVDEQSQSSRAAVSGEENDPNSQQQQPFQIVYEFQASESGKSIDAMVFHDIDARNNYGGVVCTSDGDTGDIHLWPLPSLSPSTPDLNVGEKISPTMLNGVHSDRIISLKTMILPSDDENTGERHVLFSASQDGSFALWDLGLNGELIISCQCNDVDDDADTRTVSLTCADVSNPTALDNEFSYGSESGQADGNDVIFLGTSDGYMVGYIVKDLISSMSSPDVPNVAHPEPNIRFRAHGTNSGRGDAVTAVKCGGDGTITVSANMRGGENRKSPRISCSILLTGGEDGSVKQW